MLLKALSGHENWANSKHILPSDLLNYWTEDYVEVSYLLVLNER